jgi:hypothetical protein
MGDAVMGQDCNYQLRRKRGLKNYIKNIYKLEVWRQFCVNKNKGLNVSKKYIFPELSYIS